MTGLLRRLAMTETLYPADYPEEYITEKVTFFGREFAITPYVLIPRLETEGLVRRAREVLKSEKYDRVVDIGCGSGIIGTSVADLVDEVVFLDISGSALAVAERNFRRLYPEKKAQFILSDLLENYKLRITNYENTLLLANLPYIKGDDWKNMSPDTRHEPELALFGGDETGFEMYERLFYQLSVISYQLSDGTDNPHPQISKPAIHLIIEFGFDQRGIAEKVIQSYGWKYEFFADFAGIERFAEIHIFAKTNNSSKC